MLGDWIQAQLGHDWMGAQVAKGQRWSLIPQQSDSEPLCSNYSRGPVSWYWSRDDRVDTSVKLSALRPQLDTDVTNKRYGFPPSSWILKYFNSFNCCMGR